MNTRGAVAAAVTGLAVTLVPAPVASAQPVHTLADLVDAAARRLEIADPVAANKFHTRTAVVDPAREQQVLDNVGGQARDFQIDPAYVQTAFRDQLDATVGIEYQLLAQWTFDPAAAPADAPDLASSRDIIDSLNREMVTLMAEEWGKLHSPQCAAELDAAKASVATARGLDPLYRQGLDLATRNYCR
ncbi:chorismate mutase [Mycolicibacterium sp. 018/SC-01/001]|uniref:chorismate mutase n=1 Tax=Mycolicibacterium sp. 018/SC-01/001 TaxID=2592069 RepID=UPI00117C3A4C|nr:chorismate mutase [Mycolicibacterium sp. 018/SC-01/001]TRW85569.1 chorismate mutase [Mycolicibacterium sp. 018/SC-01/001]